MRALKFLFDRTSSDNRPTFYFTVLNSVFSIPNTQAIHRGANIHPPNRVLSQPLARVPEF